MRMGEIVVHLYVNVIDPGLRETDDAVRKKEWRQENHPWIRERRGELVRVWREW